jgi:predicted nucleic acid-binding protein
MRIADTLLRLAEEQAFYTPRWSLRIIDELRRTLTGRLGYSDKQTEHRIESMISAFPEAMVTGYDDLIASMTNDPKDRHVLAAAVRCGANAIVSNNVKHFPNESLVAYELECLTADKFMENQYHLNPDAFIAVLQAQASDIGWTMPQLLSRHVPSLSQLIVAR